METGRARTIAGGYLTRVARARKRGDATEHTYRAFLQELVEALAKGVTCTNEPKGTQQAGHPDLKVSLGETPLGFIETKDIGADLDAIAETGQLQRYLKHIPNLVLTDYLEFRWYQHGELADRVRLGTFTAKGAFRRNPDAEEALGNLIDNFTRAEVKTIGSPKELAQRMAALAKLTRKHVLDLFQSEERKGDLHSLLRAFREVLLPDLDEASFADMYAQTVCYGLFASICNAEFPQTFARENAADNLPATNPFLRRLFHHIVGPDLHSKVREDIERIVFLLRHADIGAILKDFGKRTRQEDPVVHFYETFLAEYDPKLRRSRGVYYTPEPVVSYIVRSVDWLLKEKFGKKEGLADPSVVVLDPACGTGTFLYHTIRLIHERVEAKGQYGAWNSYVRHNLLPRIFGFELLMAPYAVAHLKLGLLLKDTGYDFSGDERLGIYLTNTLEEAARKSDILFAEYISEEANAATEVKKDKPVMVVLGNPPYANFGQMNRGKWILGLLDDYKKGLKEKKLNLDDDYIKFIRWGQWRIDRTGSGILAFISNNSYIDGITHRRMRKSLLDTFDSVHIIDLHGNVSRKEQVIDGSRDENVFDIQQGVAVALFTRSDSATQGVTVNHCGLRGTRDIKYRWLSEHCANNVKWRRQPARPPQYFFTLFDLARNREYMTLPGLKQIFTVVGPGTKAERDRVAINWTRTELKSVVADFSVMGEQELRAKYSLEKDSRDWSVSGAISDVMRHRGADRLAELLYRPFDTRWVWFSGQTRGLTGTPGYTHMKHMLCPNVCLVFMRQVALDAKYSHFCVANTPVDNRAFYSNKGITTVAPLYEHRSTGKSDDLFDSDEPTDAPGGRRPNLSPEFIKEFSGKLGLEFVPEQPATPVISTEGAPRPSGEIPRRPAGKGFLDSARNDEARNLFGPEDVFNYIYAVFHSPTYRKRYAEFLKIDFPRVPLTSDVKLFRKLCALGGELVALHLMESPKMDTLVTKYPKPGSNAVERVSYNDETKRVYINEDQYFEGIRPEEWEFHIGGYQVLDKWLKDRKKAKRTLSADDIRHYQRIVVAIRNTIRLMAEIDKAIPKWPVE